MDIAERENKCGGDLATSNDLRCRLPAQSSGISLRCWWGYSPLDGEASGDFKTRAVSEGMHRRSRAERIRREHFMRQIRLFVDTMAKKAKRDWGKFVQALRDEGRTDEEINDFVMKANESGLKLNDYFKNMPSEVLKRRGSVSGKASRLAVPAVERQLGAISDVEKRGRLALHLAETCYECFRVEEIFREFLGYDPADNDGIMEALANLEIQLDHIRWHIRELKVPLKDITKALGSRRAKQDVKEWKELASGLRALLGKPNRPPR